jgi:two-component sensor histidine kinase/two-component SAPR family response regulator
MGEHDKVNILLVDDQPGKLLSYEVILSELGENLIKASSAREAFAHLLKTDIAILLVDVCMPELDGFELAAMIREHPRYQQTAIIFISAVHLTDLDRLRGYECGAVDYLPVPVVPEILRAKVRTFAELYRKTRQLEQLNRELEQRVAERTAALEASTARLRESEQRRSLALAAGGMGSWDHDLLTDHLLWDEGQHYIFGVDPAGFTATPETILALVHPEDREPLQHATARAVETGQAYEAEFRIIRPDGQVRWCISGSAPTLDAAGRVVRVSGVTLDITERKDIADRQAIMAREVDHRAKNILAVVQAILRLTRAETTKEFIAAMDGRISALSRAHSLLSQAHWKAVDLGRLVDEELAPYQASKTERIAIAGPTVLLQAATAQSLALAMHELATNAAKHGALSVPQGRVTLSWQLEPETLVLRWIETDGPPASPPARQGFGATIINAGIASQLSGCTTFDWHPGGLRCTLLVPRSKLAGTLRVSGEIRSAKPTPMPVLSKPISGRRILLVEDESLIAMAMEETLTDLGFAVVGPIGSQAKAVAAAQREELDGAILDVNLDGQVIYPVADVLTARDVPFFFVTGYNVGSIDSRYAHIPILQKPIDLQELQRLLPKDMAKCHDALDGSTQVSQNVAVKSA